MKEVLTCAAHVARSRVHPFAFQRMSLESRSYLSLSQCAQELPLLAKSVHQFFNPSDPGRAAGICRSTFRTLAGTVRIRGSVDVWASGSEAIDATVTFLCGPHKKVYAAE